MGSDTLNVLRLDAPWYRIAWAHCTTKAWAVRAYLRGERGSARILWRWMANRPSAADLVKARADLERPHVKASLAKLRREQNNAH